MKQTKLKYFSLLILLISVSIHAIETDIAIKINWKQKTSSIKAEHWSVNDYEILSPNKASQFGFIDYAQKLSPSLIRVHQAGIADTWTDELTHTWNYERIKASFDSVRMAYGNAHIVFNPICAWPAWLSPSHNLTKEQSDELVRLYTELATYVKQNPNMNIAYWEIFNEGEEFWEKENRLKEHWTLFNRIVDAIRSVLPNAKIGGPAFTWTKPEWVTSFLEYSGHKIDFISWHNYASGNPETLSSEILSQGVENLVRNGKYVTEECKKKGLNIEFLLTEYNIQWVWTPFEVRHANNIGAVFQALVIKKMAPFADAIFVWHLKGHSYGLIDDNNNVRATGLFYLWGSKYLVGDMVDNSVSDEQIEVLPIRNSNKRSVLIINKSDACRTLPSTNKIGFKPTQIKQINDNWKQETLLNIKDKSWNLPAYSLTLFIE